jgi:preprotein translocase subunit SecB
MSEADAERGTRQGQVRLERMYLKDASFESPASPGVFAEDWAPEIDLQINTRSERLAETRFEVVVTVTVTARLEERTAFIAEVQQAGVFHMEGLPDQVLHRTVGTFCPGTLFPYVREAVDSLVVRGGFPPLHLVPINFDAAYEEALKSAADRGESTPPH